MRLFFQKCGPMIFYQNGMLVTEDLNPQVRVHWRMSRIDMVRLGLRCIIAAALAR